MQLTVKGKHLDVGDSLREHVRSSLGYIAGKYFDNPIDATVVFTKEKGHRYHADISVHLGGGVVLQAEHEADEPYPSFDIAAQRIETRLARYKDRVRDHRKWEEPVDSHVASDTVLQTAGKDEDEGAPVTVAETETQVMTLAVADAVMRLELGDLPALMFRNPSSGAFNMVYRRRDGNIGWIEPKVAAKEKPAPAKAAPKAAPKKKKPAQKPSKKKAAKPVKKVVKKPSKKKAKKKK